MKTLTYELADFLLVKIVSDIMKGPNDIERVWVLYGHRTGPMAEPHVVVHGVQEVPNVHEEPEYEYRVKVGSVPPEKRSQVVGVAHTHLAGTGEVGPSYGDVLCMPLGNLGVVVHVPSMTVTAFDRSGFINIINLEDL